MKTTDSLGVAMAGTRKGDQFFYCPLLPLGLWRQWVVVPHGNGGVALFPSDPPAGSADLAQATLLTATSGLPASEISGWSALGATLYIRVRDRLVIAWDADTRASALLFDNTRQIPGVEMPEADKFSINDMWTDETSQRLVLAGTLLRRIGVQSWKSRVKEGAGCLSYDPATARWAFTREVPRPDAAPDLNSKAREALQADGIEDILDVAVWQDKILAVIGQGESWQLELLTKE
jgi:hypothetical protein